MSAWQLLSDAAWVVSVLLFLWILIDLLLVPRKYDEEYLMSAREGSDVLLDKASDLEERK